MVPRHRGGLDVETGKGTVFVRVQEPTDDPIRLVSREHSIQLGLPAGVGFRVAARTLKGEARNGFGLAVEPLRGGGSGEVTSSQRPPPSGR